MDRREARSWLRRFQSELALSPSPPLPDWAPSVRPAPLPRTQCTEHECSGNPPQEYRIELGLEGDLGRRRIRPNNVWSLHGLYECLAKLGLEKEARDISLQRDIALASADINIEASCFCRLSAFEDNTTSCC